MPCRTSTRLIHTRSSLKCGSLATPSRPAHNADAQVKRRVTGVGAPADPSRPPVGFHVRPRPHKRSSVRVNTSPPFARVRRDALVCGRARRRGARPFIARPRIVSFVGVGGARPTRVAPTFVDSPATCGVGRAPNAPTDSPLGLLIHDARRYKLKRQRLR